MSQGLETIADEPGEFESPSPKRRSILVYIPCAFLVMFGLGMAVFGGVLLGMALYNPELMDFPVTTYTLFSLICGHCGGLAWVASGILFYVHQWRWALILLLIGYGLAAFSHSVTSPVAN